MTDISIDKEACIGCTLCTQLCPDCFEIGPDDKANVVKTDCPGCDLDDVASKCPVSAITVKK